MLFIELGAATYYVRGSVSKEPACNAGNPGLIPGLARCPGEGNGNPFQYSCLKNSMDRGAWGGYSPWGRKELAMNERLTLTLFFTEAEVGGNTQMWVLLISLVLDAEFLSCTSGPCPEY